MKGELKLESRLSEIKEWYNQNIDLLPETLDSECRYYSNVKNTVEIYFHRIEAEIKRLGVENIKRSAVAISAKKNLYVLYLDLQFIENWNAPRPTLETFKIKING